MDGLAVEGAKVHKNDLGNQPVSKDNATAKSTLAVVTQKKERIEPTLAIKPKRAVEYSSTGTKDKPVSLLQTKRNANLPTTIVKQEANKDAKVLKQVPQNQIVRKPTLKTAEAERTLPNINKKVADKNITSTVASGVKPTLSKVGALQPKKDVYLGNAPPPKKMNPLLAEFPKEKKLYEEKSDHSNVSDDTESSAEQKPKKVKQKKPQFNKNASNYEDWKKKNNIPYAQKVYIVSGGLNDLKKSLDSRGWIENTDQESPFYDFKWAIKSKDVIFSEMEEFQIVNHFTKNTLLTTKSGLAKSLRSVNNFHDVDQDSFFPRCFNLNEQEEIEDFELEYRFSYVRFYYGSRLLCAESIL
jgi:hypothetical protein